MVGGDGLLSVCSGSQRQGRGLAAFLRSSAKANAEQGSQSTTNPWSNTWSMHVCVHIYIDIIYIYIYTDMNIIVGDGPAAAARESENMSLGQETNTLKMESETIYSPIT